MPGERGPRRAGAFTEREVQLVLLRRMADLQEPLVEAALRRMGSSRGEMREANRRWNAVAFGRPGPLRHSRYTRALGRPAVDRAPAPAPTLAEAGVFRSCWPLALWPGLWLQVLVDADDVVWHTALVRADGEPPAVLRTVADAIPWSCTLAECAQAFTDVTFHDAGLTGHEALTCTAPGAAGGVHGADGAGGAGGAGGRWRMRSVWGLLQRVEPAEVPSARARPRG